ncbi:hypothetical protein fugu_018878 [Takifugu bimaculatus]|uniref:Uncharacterized protein n=1 Tax=Takifugu bimaculatus TaxID=433685 RepID=A0A4Z2BK04_9TELE|nr:hypothetical protein fugu_018878 [Takifugu bimaculatus]
MQPAGAALPLETAAPSSPLVAFPGCGVTDTPPLRQSAAPPLQTLDDRRVDDGQSSSGAPLRGSSVAPKLHPALTDTPGPFQLCSSGSCSHTGGGHASHHPVCWEVQLLQQQRPSSAPQPVPRRPGPERRPGRRLQRRSPLRGKPLRHAAAPRLLPRLLRLVRDGEGAPPQQRLSGVGEPVLLAAASQPAAARRFLSRAGVPPQQQRQQRRRRAAVPQRLRHGQGPDLRARRHGELWRDVLPRQQFGVGIPRGADPASGSHGGLLPRQVVRVHLPAELPPLPAPVRAHDQGVSPVRGAAAVRRRPAGQDPFSGGGAEAGAASDRVDGDVSLRLQGRANDALPQRHDAPGGPRRRVLVASDATDDPATHQAPLRPRPVRGGRGRAQRRGAGAAGVPEEQAGLGPAERHPERV